ncbi:MAG TPA: SDR family oxidoreductase [Candidatus Nanoarchaeia archaeon]|nr:SDR family oxidoreductase [Candidatus Nanoarchaeia archaeon]
MYNKSILITGSTKGLGKELALQFAKKGYNIIITGRNEENLQSVEKEIKLLGRKCYKVKGDIRQAKTREDLIKMTDSLLTESVILNAGLDINGKFSELSEEQVEEIISINYLSSILLARQFYKKFSLRREGSIIAINSISGLEIQKARVIYCSTKWGLRAFITALREEAKGTNVSIFSIFPSRIRTKPEFTFGMLPSYAAEKIVEHYLSGSKEDLILDDRPPEFRKKGA